MEDNSRVNQGWHPIKVSPNESDRWESPNEEWIMSWKRWSRLRRIKIMEYVQRFPAKSRRSRENCNMTPRSYPTESSLKHRTKLREMRHPVGFYLLYLILLYAIRLDCYDDVTSCLVSADTPPHITTQPIDLIAVEGESAELSCDAEGEPEPTIEWYHNEQLVRQSSARTTLGGSIQFLDIRPNQFKPNSRQSDAGIYYCLARNSAGQAKSRNASLQVACK